MADVTYLLSPKDLAAIDLMPELIDAGVVSFKIEGRLKTPEYVANVVSKYRKVVISILMAIRPRPAKKISASCNRAFHAALRTVFSKGPITRSWLTVRSRKAGGCIWVEWNKSFVMV